MERVEFEDDEIEALYAALFLDIVLTDGDELEQLELHNPALLRAYRKIASVIED